LLDAACDALFEETCSSATSNGAERCQSDRREEGAAGLWGGAESRGAKA
jgi:hypothetical protein